MFGYGQRFEALLYGGIAALTGIIFVSDLLFPLGTAVWVIYLLPVALCYLASRPSVPVVTASIITVLVVVAYFFAPVGVDPDIVRGNRVLGALTAWVVAGTGYLFITNKLAIWRQEWLQTGQVGLARSASGDQNVKEVSEGILKYLAEYLDASAGAIFIREDNVFRRRGAYGVPSDAPVPASFDPEDGLLGQAVRDRRSFTIDDVPDEYLYFGSGLGRSKPRHLLITPASSDDEINAVVELGFSRPVSADTRELLQRVAEPIGIAVRSAEYRARLHDLLQETQRQTEELQTQSEELRSANEELEEQRRSLQESQSRLELQQSELEQTNAQLEEQTDQLESQRDELSRAQGELQVQARNLEQASRYKSDFLANMSHELRTPLNSLLIMAGLLAENRDGNLTADQVKYASTIETSGNDLLTLINDILDISRIEAGRLELQPQPVNIRDMIEKLHSTFQAAAEEKAIEFKTQIAPETPEEMQADPQRIEQVLKNFLSNAVKFTAEGEIALSVDKTGDGRLAFTVRDTGAGIPADQQETIFEAFRQADSAIDRKYGGTGLGLSICKEMSRLLGGDVAVDSEVGKGSAFTLIVPQDHDGSAATPGSGETSLRASRAEKAPPTAHPERPDGEEHPQTPAQRPRQVEDDRERLSGDSRTVLVVEDDPTFSRILYELAHELGFQCLIAESADEGVLLARQYLPVGVILDIGLPDHTGLSVLDRIKHDVRTRHIPVHVVSVSDHTQTALQFGAMSYLTKPVKRADLVHILEGLETELAQRMRRVLVVEDDATQLESLRSLLASEEIETVCVCSAGECLERLKEETFDCMVLDLSLPDASGFDVLETLGDNDSYAFPPPIVYTGRDLTNDEELRLRKFSKSIIIKGAKSPERLLDEVTLFLHQVISDLPDQKRDLLVKSLNRDAVLEERCILVVEDDVRNVYALTSVLEPHGATVRIARNGQEALDVLDEISNDEEGSTVDLVLMDIMMPEMDGLTATREIRKKPEWKQLPVIALTAKAMANDQEQCLAAGANDYLAKPLDVEKLLSLLRVWIQR